MRHLHSFILLLALMGLVLQASGCAVYDAAVEERSVGTYVDDEAITFQIEKDFLADDKVKYLDYDASSYEGHVYIVGEYESRAQVDRAVAIAKGVDGVIRVTTYMLPKNPKRPLRHHDNLEIYGRLKKGSGGGQGHLVHQRGDQDGPVQRQSFSASSGPCPNAKRSSTTPTRPRVCAASNPTSRSRGRTGWAA